MNIGLRIDLDATAQILARARKEVVERPNRRFREQVYRMFEDLLIVSPQFSGDFASNWRISTSGFGFYSEWPGKGSVAVSQQPHQAGDPEAITYARDSAARQTFDYREPVYFVNETPLTFTETTVTGPDGKVRNLRAENLIPGGLMVTSYLKAKYGQQ